MVWEGGIRLCRFSSPYDFFSQQTFNKQLILIDLIHNNVVTIKKTKDIHVTSVEFDPEMKLALFCIQRYFLFSFCHKCNHS